MKHKTELRKGSLSRWASTGGPGRHPDPLPDGREAGCFSRSPAAAPSPNAFDRMGGRADGGDARIIP